MRGKRGEFLTKEGLELLLAVIAILLVVYVVAILWNTFVNSEEQNAKKTANLIEAKINALQNGQSNIFLIQGFSGSKNWLIAGWGKGGQGRPDACYFNSCICVCQNSGPPAVSCAKKGFCRIFKSADSVKVTERRTIIDQKYLVSYTLLKTNILELNISKDISGNIEFTSENIDLTAPSDDQLKLALSMG